jgi:hypothetical protein
MDDDYLLMEGTPVLFVESQNNIVNAKNAFQDLEPKLPSLKRKRRFYGHFCCKETILRLYCANRGGR